MYGAQAYRGDFLHNHLDKITGRNVIELAAGDGGVTRHLLAAQPNTLVVTDIEAHVGQSELVDQMIYQTSIDILSNLDQFYTSNQQFDTAVCCGYLYHCPHPLFAVERMLYGRPKWFYLETTFEPETRVSDAKTYHVSPETTMKVRGEITLHDVQIGAKSLGYHLIDTITRPIIPDNRPIEERYVDAEQTQGNHFGDDYQMFWSKTTGLWFERND